MKVVYLGYGGSHASPVAAAIHLGTLPADVIPDNKTLYSLPLFDSVPPSFHGSLIQVGTDATGNDVFVLGTRGHSDILIKTIKGITRIIREDHRDYLFADVKPCINLYMRIGGFLSRYLGLVAIGRPLVAWGVRRAYPKIVALVKRTYQRLGQDVQGGS
ncbi:MAG: DUF3189 family protein [Firmicutes bacterium]|nr:DUF3189 family protein [Bacillota bacterium]